MVLERDPANRELAVPGLACLALQRYAERVRRYAFLLAAVLFLPSPVKAAGSIVTAYVSTKEPLAGKPITLEIGVTTDETPDWSAADYAFVLRLRSHENALIAQSKPIAGTQTVSNGEVTIEFAQWTLPQSASGYYQLEIVLLHHGVTANTAAPLSLAVGTGENAQVVTHPTASPAPVCVHGSTQSTANFGRPSETSVLSLNGCLPNSSSYTASAGFSSAPGSVRPVVEFDMPQSRLRGGALSPEFNPLSLNGVNGNGGLFAQMWGPERTLTLTWLRQQGDPLGPAFAAVQYSIRSPNLVAAFDAGHTRLPAAAPDYGSLSTWSDGDFATLSLTWSPPPMRNSFGIRFGMVNYLDADGQTRHFDRALEAFATLSIGATSWSLDELRTGHFYLAPGAPAIIADRDAQKISASFPLGSITATLSAEGYRDDLPGANLSLKTNNWAENASFSIPIHDDVASLTFIGGSQQQDGDFPSNFATNGFSAAYVLRRGDQSVQFSYGVVGMRSDPDQAQTQVQAGIQVSRNVARGLSVALGTNVADARASDSFGGSFTHSNFLTLSFTQDPWTLSSSVVQTLTQPGFGAAPPQTLALNTGLAFKLPAHLSLKLSLTRMNGSTPSTIGNLALGTQF